MVNNLGLATNSPHTPLVYPSKRLDPIHHNSSHHFSVQYWYYTDKWTWNRRFSCNDSRGAILKARGQKWKGYRIQIYSNLPSSPYMHHLNVHKLRLYSHIYRRMGNTTQHNTCWLRFSLYEESNCPFFSFNTRLILYTVSPPTHICQYVWSSLGGMCPEASI